ncbi:hypothetical protein KDX23_20855 [Burkholderia vietnamiensis]|uniref:hypothetical protein n=1 Tax=Burkholderia vietnamiensis TaxID=60552 RepID=UPI001B99D730|nr:hypothetical protein [Burkholderia vietnamiensis]MBR8085195.1 hypothetical protein [Burkholderia vietnamiensis]
MGIDELLFAGAMGFNAGSPRGWRDGTCALCSTPMACQQIGICQFSSQSIRNAQAAPTNTARQSYDVDLPPDAVREVSTVPALPPPPIEGDSDGGECD